MTPNEKQKHAQQVMQQFGFTAASKEWLDALHAAQSMAKPIERNKSIPDKYGKHKFYIAPAEDFTGEGRRCLLSDGVRMGWFRVTTMITELNAHTGSLKLTGCYIVYHKPSSQAQAFYVEWTTRSDGDAMAGAHTRLTRRFIQGLLQIAVVDEGIVPEDPPSGCPHPRERHVVNADSSVVCTLCGEHLGYAPQDQQQPPPSQAAIGPPVVGRVVTEPMFPGPSAPPMQQVQVQPPQQEQVQPPQQEQYHPPQQTLPPISHSAIVQEAQRILEAEPVTEEQMQAELTAPIEVAAPQDGSGDPSTPEAWRDALMAQGLDPETALQIAMLDDSRVVEIELVEDMRNWSWAHYQGNVEKIQAAFHAVGFEPVPSLPIEQRPRPTGIQAKRYLVQIIFKSKSASPA